MARKKRQDPAQIAGEKAKAAVGWATGMVCSASETLGDLSFVSLQAGKFIRGDDMFSSSAEDKAPKEELIRPFTETGAGQLDVDLTALQHFFGEHSSKSLRRVFARLNQVLEIDNCAWSI